MNFFSGVGRRAAALTEGAQPPRRVLEQAVSYAGRLALPEPSGRMELRLIEEQPGTGQTWEGKSRYSLLVYADGTAEGAMNAGYAAGLAASFLRFQGYAAEIVRDVPEISGDCIQNTGTAKDRRKGGMLGCIACFAFGGESRRKKRAAREKEVFCICTQERRDWGNELLALTKTRYPRTFRWLAVSRQENGLLLSEKRSSRKKVSASAFETGLAAANLMTAADELWLDLELIREQESEKSRFRLREKKDRSFASLQSQALREKPEGLTAPKEPTVTAVLQKQERKAAAMQYA